MNETEELIKAALTKHVEGAPHPGPILNALSRRRRRVRPTLIAIVAATAVAAGIAIPIVVQKPEASAPPATQQPIPVDPPKGIKMRYGLKPLPGYVEVNRTADIDGSHQFRVWMNNTCDSGRTGPECSLNTTLSVYAARHPYFAEVAAPKGERVTVNGTEAWLSTDPQQRMAKLSWRPTEPDTVLLLSLFDPKGNTKQRVLDLARTVAADNTAVVQPALSFGWLPAELTRTSVTVAGSSPSSADTWIDAEMADPRGADVQAKIVAKAFDDAGSRMVAVTLPDGRHVQVQGSGNTPLALDKVRRIADSLKVEPAPDTSWVGK